MKHLVPIVLVTVASSQLMCAHLGPLADWKGGGFGMFSTLDTPADRHLSVEAIDQHGEVFSVLVAGAGNVEALSGTYIARTVAFPSHKRLDTIAAAVLRSRLTLARDPKALMPARLQQSPLGNIVLEKFVTKRRVLELIRAGGVADPFSGLIEIRTRVLRLRAYNRLVTLEPLPQSGQATTIAQRPQQ